MLSFINIVVSICSTIENLFYNTNKQKNFFNCLPNQMTSFPRLSSLSPTDTNFVKAKRLTKDVLLAQIYQLQADKDQLSGKAAMLQDKVESVSLKDWSDVLNRANQLATKKGKADCRETWSDLKKVASAISFRIKTA